MVEKKLSSEDETDLERVITLLSDDVSSERRRVGGDWAIAGAWCLGLRKRDRDIIRSDQNTLFFLIPFPGEARRNNF